MHQHLFKRDDESTSCTSSLFGEPESLSEIKCPEGKRVVSLSGTNVKVFESTGGTPTSKSYTVSLSIKCDDGFEDTVGDTEIESRETIQAGSGEFTDLSAYYILLADNVTVLTGLSVSAQKKSANTIGELGGSAVKKVESKAPQEGWYLAGLSVSFSENSQIDNVNLIWSSAEAASNSTADNSEDKCSKSTDCGYGYVCHENACKCVSESCMEPSPTSDDLCEDASCFEKPTKDGEVGSPLTPALSLAKLSQAIYEAADVEGFKTHETALIPFPKELLEFGLYKETSSGKFFLAFRGTAAISNWVFNVAVLPKCDDGSEDCTSNKGHAGFIQAYENVKEHVRNALDSHNVTSISITGHSLGGAMAAIAAKDLAETDVEIKSFATFGAPAIGDKEFTESIEKILPETKFRFVAQSQAHTDVVTTILGESDGFYHVPEKADPLDCVRTDGSKCDDYKHSILEGGPVHDWIDTHFDLHEMSYYVSSLEKAIGE